MKALTLHASWAYAVRSLGKRIENRTWSPPAALIGQRIAIHAGQRADEAQLADAFERRDVARNGGPTRSFALDRVRDLRGHVVGAATLVGLILPGGTVTTREARDALRSLWPEHQPMRWWVPGHVGWVLADFRPATVGPVRGAQGLWTLPAGLAAELEVRDAA